MPNSYRLRVGPVVLSDYSLTAEVGVLDVGSIGATLSYSGVTEHPNEPDGLTPYLDRSFDALDEDGWTDGGGINSNPQTISIEVDATAPNSPSNVGRTTYPTGHPGSGSSSRTARWSDGFTTLDTAGQQIYIEFWFKISSNFYGHTGGQNKIFYIGQPVIFEYGYSSGASGGSGNDAMYWVLALQGGVTRNLDYNDADNEVSPSAAQATVTRNVWHHVEILMEMNTPGVANGSAHLWANGVKILQFTGNMNILAASGDYSFINNLAWHPIYGGQNGESVPADQYQEIDHIYVSGG